MITGRTTRNGCTRRIAGLRRTRPRRATRAFWLVAALWQLALPGSAAWADARLDAAGATAQPHVESHTSNSCARIHPPDCALCHFLTAPAVRTPGGAPLPDVAGLRRLTLSDPAALPCVRARPHPQSRAPPRLS